MIQSRVILLSRILNHSLRSKGVQNQSIRRAHAEWNYRQGPPESSHPAYVRYGAPVVAGLMWWWVLWHLWHEPEHITGEFPEPDPKLWTDKELGIPPDDYEGDE